MGCAEIQLSDVESTPSTSSTLDQKGEYMRINEAAALRRAVVLSIAATAGAAVAAPTFTPVGPLDANVLGISADGSVLVGTHIFGAYVFRWTREGGAEILGPALGMASISRDGSTIVADIRTGGQSTAAIWQGGTEWQSIGGYPGSNGCPDLSNAYGVSNGGAVIVGLGWDDCNATGFRWEVSTGIVSLGSLNGRASRANDISADGTVIVGWDDADDGSRRGARWVNGVESLLSQSDLFLGGAEAVTADGSVIVGGNAGGPFERNQAYRWSEARGGELIGMLPNDDPLAAAYAFAVSDDGRVIVGASGARSRESFVWTRATGMINLQDYLVDLGVQGLEDWELDTALAISSDATTIAGWGIRNGLRVQSWVVDGLPPFVDTDRDTRLDAVDNCSRAPNTDQRDTDGDLYGNRCDPDFDNDLVVDQQDVAYLQSVFGTADADGDLDGDGVVGESDVRITRRFLGHAPGPSGRIE
jgi:uncharacterized membrane protein